MWSFVACMNLCFLFSLTFTIITRTGCRNWTLCIQLRTLLLCLLSGLSRPQVTLHYTYYHLHVYKLESRTVAHRGLGGRDGVCRLSRPQWWHLAAWGRNFEFWEPKYFILLLAASKYVKYFNRENTCAGNLWILVRSRYVISNKIQLYFILYNSHYISNNWSRLRTIANFSCPKFILTFVFKRITLVRLISDFKRNKTHSWKGKSLGVQEPIFRPKIFKTTSRYRLTQKFSFWSNIVVGLTASWQKRPKNQKHVWHGRGYLRSICTFLFFLSE